MNQTTKETRRRSYDAVLPKRAARCRLILETLGNRELTASEITEELVAAGRIPYFNRNYYCHPYRPSERGSNENQNGLIRRHLPKGTDLSTISYEETKRIEDWLNNYPRKMFGYLCSEQLFREEIALILAS